MQSSHAFLLILVCTLSMGGCSPKDEAGPQDAQADVALGPLTLACIDAGNYCRPVENPGCGAGSKAVGECEDNSYCCASRTFRCGTEFCYQGNTCDGTFAGYCSGATNTANCGDYACLDVCTCNGGACDCPRCQHADQQTGPNGPYCPGGVLYLCDPPLSLDAGTGDFPDAGGCVVQSGGNVCCAE